MLVYGYDTGIRFTLTSHLQGVTWPQCSEHSEHRNRVHVTLFGCVCSQRTIVLNPQCANSKGCGGWSRKGMYTGSDSYIGFIRLYLKWGSPHKFTIRLLITNFSNHVPKRNAVILFVRDSTRPHHSFDIITLVVGVGSGRIHLRADCATFARHAWELIVDFKVSNTSRV